MLRPAPWQSLDPAVAEPLWPVVPRLVEEVMAAVLAAVPMYEGVLDHNVKRGVEQGLRGFLELIEGRHGGQLPGRDVYVWFGRGESRNGRPLDALLTAYRAGAQVAWRGLAEAGHRAGLEPSTLYTLAEAIFAYVDELSSASAEGFAQEQSVLAQERQERCRRLVELLLREPPSDPTELEETARAVPWELPRRLAVLVLAEEDVRRVEARLPADAIVAARGGLARAVVPDPEGPGRRAALERALGGAPAGLGPAVVPVEAARSAREAQLAFAIARERPEAGLVAARERLLDVILAQDRILAGELVRRRLAPLEELPAGARERLLQTLAAWLECQGSARAAARRLHVHVQTVRYRLGRLRELLGDALDEPRARLELELALRVAGLAYP